MVRAMGRFGFWMLLLLLLILCMGVFINAHSVATQSGLDPDLTETFEVGTITAVLVSSFISGVILVRFSQQVLLSKQIILSFFSFSWHNSFYGKLDQLFVNWHKAENMATRSRPFSFYGRF
jgi:hypothetical protein